MFLLSHWDNTTSKHIIYQILKLFKVLICAKMFNMFKNLKTTVHERGEYLSDAILSASDGVVTTFAVVAGSAGASLDTRVVLILGFANLFADGFSMASGNYLAAKGEIEYEKGNGEGLLKEGKPLLHGVVSFIAFNLAGIIPLLPFIFVMEPRYGLSTVLVGVAMFAVGALKSVYTKSNVIKGGTETLLVGGLASFIAFFVGFLLDKYII